MPVTQNRGRRRAYARWKLRLPTRLADRCTQLAENEGWETSDLIRTLICLSATPTFLSLPGNERFRKQVELRRIVGKRAYAPRLGSCSTVVCSIQFPEWPSRLIMMYADCTGNSRNNMVTKFLQGGLVMYLKGENALLEVIRSLRLRC